MLNVPPELVIKMMVVILLKMRSWLSIICAWSTQSLDIGWLGPRRFNATTNTRDQLLNANSWRFLAKFNLDFMVLESTLPNSNWR